MFDRAKRQKLDAGALFEAALRASRNPVLYRDYGVPDTFDGRFDALLLHLWPVFRALEADDKAAQALYDFTFRRMELALRETGTGDLGVGRQVRVMMKAFYGRLTAYSAAQTEDEWRAVLARNLYGTVPEAQVAEPVIRYAQALGRMGIDAGSSTITYPVITPA